MAEYRQNTGYDKLIANSGEWDESKHPRDDDGKFTSGGGRAKDETDGTDSKGGTKNAEPEVVELDENSELARLIASSDRNKYDTIRRYLIENFGGRELELSDGKKAVIDKSDAKELAHKADNKRTAEIAELEAIIKKARFLMEKAVSHNKFTAFRYYTAPIRYKGELSEIILNVGIHSYDKKLHLYAITNRPLKQ